MAATFTEPQLVAGLNALSAAIAADNLTANGQRLEIFCMGGYVCIAALHNRTTTGDVDYYPLNFDFNGATHNRLKQLCENVAAPLNMPINWCNSSMERYIVDPGKAKAQTRQQGFVLVESPHIKVYAADWGYGVFRKMVAISRAIRTGGQAFVRQEDVSDAAAMANKMVVEQRQGDALPAAEVKVWYDEEQEKISNEAFLLVNQESQARYQRAVFGL